MFGDGADTGGLSDQVIFWFRQVDRTGIASSKDILENQKTGLVTKSFKYFYFFIHIEHRDTLTINVQYYTIVETI